jgi:hypothetical protein
MGDPVGTPSCVAIDLTPVLPGGENGGAKVFALDLVAQLAKLAPKCRFVLLTQDVSHHELGALEAGNVRRVQVLGPAASADAGVAASPSRRRGLSRLPPVEARRRAAPAARLGRRPPLLPLHRAHLP